MRILGLTFAGTATAQRAAMARFAAEQLGLERVEVGGVSADMFALPDGSSFAVADPRSMGDTSRSIGFLVADLEEAVAELRAAGVEVDDPAQNDRQRYVHFRRPTASSTSSSRTSRRPDAQRTRGACALALDEHAPQDLARGRLRDLVDELDGAHPLLRRDALARRTPSARPASTSPRGTTNAFGTSPASSSGIAITAASATCGMGQQHRLELGGRDLVALVLDQLLEPVDDLRAAVGVDGADVAGVEPALGVDRSRAVASGSSR